MTIIMQNAFLHRVGKRRNV